jgi:hypothetical protein
MKKYKVTYVESRFVVEIVEAENEDQAEDLFYDQFEYQSADYEYYNVETQIEEIEEHEPSSENQK